MIYPEVYIVILNWNGLADTAECIESLKKNNYDNFKILIVDNASDTDCQKLSEIKNIELISLKRNIGFSGGNNAGIEYALNKGADFVLLLNNDTVVTKDFLSRLVIASKNSGAAICAPLINYFSNPDTIWYGGGKISRFRGSAFDKNKGKSSKLVKEERLVDFASGCCMLVRKDVFNSIGKFDENYFLYLEDVDFCKRAADAGFNILLVPESKIFHKVNASTFNKNTDIPLYYNTRNRLYFTKKFFQAYLRKVYNYIKITMYVKFIFWHFKGEKSKINTIKKAFKDFDNNKMGKREDLL